ncbi:LysR family transcriptional regulator [Sciscionella marina]|uniref:LysR family transcriptional regulator n=1 Tax=Sciscionella marina TaxID=508770 RepID=UPI00037A8610|nr:LysR family transcriptional regulator [Sciscionella marina]
MELSMHRLRLLRELARRETLTATATALHYTTSAVSQQLQQLEREVGLPLFERIGRKVVLTELGQLLAQHAEEILGAEERAVIALERAQANLAAKVSVGVFATVAAGLLPRSLAWLATHYPDIEVHTREVDPEETARAVGQGDFDLAFVIDYPDAPMPWDANLERRNIGRERLHAVVPSGALTPQSPVALTDLADARWILAGKASHFGNAVRVACQHQGFEPDVRHEVEEQATAMAMVAAGLGVTLVPDLGLAFRWSAVEVVELADPITRDIAIAYRTSAHRRPALRVVIDAFATAADQLGLTGSTEGPLDHGAAASAR